MRGNIFVCCAKLSGSIAMAVLLGGAAIAGNYIPEITQLKSLNAGMVCVIGSSKANPSAKPPIQPYYLTKSGTQGVWTPVTSTTPSVTALELGSDITSIVNSPAKDRPYINSALIRFFVIGDPKNVKCSDITFTFSNTATGDINVTHYPYPNVLFEMTAWRSGDDSLLTLDTSNVDSFQAPIAMTVTQDATTLAEIGNPVSLPNAARTTMITGPQDLGGDGSPFVAWLKGQPGYASAPKIFEGLALSSAAASPERYPYAMLLSPKDYLNAKCMLNGSSYTPPTCSLNNATLHWHSPLNSYFDAELATFFKNAFADPSKPLLVMGDASGPIGQGAWTATSNTSNCPVYLKPDGQSLALTMGANTTVICNPVGQVVPMAGPPPATFTKLSASQVQVNITKDQFDLYSQKYGGWNFGQPETGFIGTIASFQSGNGTYSVTVNVLIENNVPNVSYPAWAFSNINANGNLNIFESPSEMVFANDGAFSSWTPVYVTNADLQTVTLSIQRNFAAAFSRGVANCNNVTMAASPIPAPCQTMQPGSMTSGTPAGVSDAYWSNEVNWYPAHGVQDYYAQYLHAARLDAQGNIVPGVTCSSSPCTNISVTPNNSIPGGAVGSNQGIPMGMAYGFGYDENPVYVNSPALVPSKLDPIPQSWGTGLSLTVTIGRTKPAVQ